MVSIRDAFHSSGAFDFQVNAQGIVQLSFGPTHICMTLDSAYELQYSLAAFLAELELHDFPEEPTPGVSLTDSQNNLKDLAAYQRRKQVDA